MKTTAFVLRLTVAFGLHALTALSAQAFTVNDGGFGQVGVGITHDHSPVGVGITHDHSPVGVGITHDHSPVGVGITHDHSPVGVGITHDHAPTIGGFGF